MSVPINSHGILISGNTQDEFDFATDYANNLSAIRAEYKAMGITPTQRDINHARIKSAVYAATNLSRKDSMGAFFLDSQEPEDGMYDNFMPELDWF